MSLSAHAQLLSRAMSRRRNKALPVSKSAHGWSPEESISLTSVAVRMVDQDSVTQGSKCTLSKGNCTFAYALISNSYNAPMPNDTHPRGPSMVDRRNQGPVGDYPFNSSLQPDNPRSSRAVTPPHPSELYPGDAPSIERPPLKVHPDRIQLLTGSGSAPEKPPQFTLGRRPALPFPPRHPAFESPPFPNAPGPNDTPHEWSALRANELPGPSLHQNGFVPGNGPPRPFVKRVGSSLLERLTLDEAPTPPLRDRLEAGEPTEATAGEVVVERDEERGSFRGRGGRGRGRRRM